MRGERADLSVVSMVDQFIPLDWAFVIYTEVKVKIRNMVEIGAGFVALLKAQCKYYIP